VSLSRWDHRIARAVDLESACPAARDLLRFYRSIAAFQNDHAAQNLDELKASIPDLRCLLERTGHPDLAACEFTPAQLDAFWQGADLDPAPEFFARVLLEPYAARVDGCPWCTRKPHAALLRPEGHGARRSLVCALCFAERPFPRVRCPACGEEEFSKLPVYTAEEFNYIRIDACETCRCYIKTIDLTKNGLAEPLVDDLATIALDLWAREQGYTKVAPNLMAL